jgi:hypothetical protein
MDRDLVAIAISVASWLTAAWAAVKAYKVGQAQAKAAQEQAETQRRLLALETMREHARIRETKRARLVARLVDEDGRRRRLVIRNEGQGAARDIRVSLDGRPAALHDWMPRGSGLANWSLGEETDITFLGPQGEAFYELGIHSGSPRMAAIAISWTDDSGQPGAWESQVAW